MPTIWLSITDCVRDNAIKETPLLTLLSRQLFALNIDSDNAIHCIGVQRYRFLEMSWYFATSIIGHFHLAFLPRLMDGEKHSVAEMSETELIPNQFAYQILRKLSAGNLCG